MRYTLEREQKRKAAIAVGLCPAAHSSKMCQAKREPSRDRRRAASIWSCSGCGISSMVVLGMVRLLDVWWMLGNVHRIIEDLTVPILCTLI